MCVGEREREEVRKRLNTLLAGSVRSKLEKSSGSNRPWACILSCYRIAPYKSAASNSSEHLKNLLLVN